MGMNFDYDSNLIKIYKNMKLPIQHTSYDYNLLDSNVHNITFVSERKQIYRASEKNIGEKHRRKTSE